MTLQAPGAAAASRYAYEKVAQRHFEVSCIPAEFQAQYDLLNLPADQWEALGWRGQLAALPFVKMRPDGQYPQSYWAVTPTGNYRKDQITGRAFAELLLLFIGKGGSTSTLSQVYRDMPAEHPSVVAQCFGFFIAAAAAQGVSVAAIGALREDRLSAARDLQEAEWKRAQCSAAGRKGAAVTNAKRAAKRQQRAA